MAVTNAERQNQYRDRQKAKNEKEYLQKERDRKKKTYVPSSELSASQRKKRNAKKIISNRACRKRKANVMQEVLVLKLNFPAKANGSKARRKKILLDKNNALKR